MKINIYILASVFVLCYAVLPLVLSNLLKQQRKALKVIMAILLADYIFVLGIFTCLNVKFLYPNLIISPKFDDGWFSMNFAFWGNGLFNYLSNLTMFLPLGIFVFNLREKKKYISTIVLAFLLSITIEVLQFVLPIARTTELADIVLGTISGIVSASFCKVFYSIKK